MQAVVKQLSYDVDGYDIVSHAIRDLLNQYPGLPEDMTIEFSTLEEESGISFYPVSGAIITSEKRFITGNVEQICNYPFFVVYRSSSGSEKTKINIKEFLDNLGKWLEKQPVRIGNDLFAIDEWPALTQGRKIIEISRQSPSYPEAPQENGVQDWVISLSLKYMKVFRRR